ncbi:MAG: hypothetical protein RQ729_10300 [Wenzhouxiangellaceae bacterium]|nr:hypothetical protein [Wenzhouxiangellaceae bacterium]
MIHSRDDIRLLAAVEFDRIPPARRALIERDPADRLAGAIAEDLAQCVASVIQGHLLTGPALLEPGQLLSPEVCNPWATLASLARPGVADAPGVTAFGCRDGRASHATLAPRRAPRMPLLCLPLLLRMPSGARAETATELEQRLFDQAGLRPPALAELAAITGADPVHGQLMTVTDLMALVKMQLAGAALDAFWPPAEHALLTPDEECDLTLPAGLGAHWSVARQAWQLALPALDEAALSDPDTALWLRAFRHTTAVLDEHQVPWQVIVRDDEEELDAEQRWLCRDLGPADATQTTDHARAVLLEPVGLVGYRVVLDDRDCLLLPLKADAIGALHAWLGARGIALPERSGSGQR